MNPSLGGPSWRGNIRSLGRLLEEMLKETLPLTWKIKKIDLVVFDSWSNHKRNI